jgi:hypothetical protein
MQTEELNWAVHLNKPWGAWHPTPGLLYRVRAIIHYMVYDMSQERNPDGFS